MGILLETNQPLMKTRYTLLALVLLVNYLNSQSHDQHKIDSLLNIVKQSKKDTSQIESLSKIWKYYLDNDTDKSMDYANQILEISNELNYPKGKGLGHLYRGAIYSQLSEFEKSSHELKKSFKIFRHNGLKKEEILATSNIARFG